MDFKMLYEIKAWWDGLYPIEQNNPVNIARYETANKAIDRVGSTLANLDGVLSNAESATVQYSLEKTQKEMWNLVSMVGLPGQQWTAYTRLIDLFGLSDRIQAVLPFDHANWYADVNGQYNRANFFNIGTNRWSLGVRLGRSHKLIRIINER